MSYVKKLGNWWMNKIRTSGTGGKIIIVLLTLFCACCICSVPIAILNPSSVNSTQLPTQIPAQAIVLATPTEAPTLIPTIQPTDTAIPPIPTAEPPKEPIVIDGSSSNVVDFDLTAFGGLAVAHIENVGGGNFALWTLDSGNNQLDLLINTIGNYDGYIPVNFLDSEKATRFQIESDGTWRIQLLPLESIKYTRVVSKGQTYQSKSDDVVFVTDPPALASFSTNTEGNFAVWSYENGRGRDLLINEIGPYSGVVPFREGLFLVVVTSDGPWQVEVK